GEAFRLQVVNAGRRPIRITGDGLVVEPLKPAAGQTLRRRVEPLDGPGRNRVSATLTAFCLEFHRDPPEEGMIFRPADARTQQQYEPARRLLRGGRHAQASGKLTPDSNPVSYFFSLLQWAWWIRELGLTQATFADRLVEYTARNAVQAGQPWTKEMEQVVRK